MTKKRQEKWQKAKKEQKMQPAFVTERKENWFYEIITTAVIKRNTQQSLPNM